MSVSNSGERTPHNSLKDIFTIPIIIGALTTVGLISALVGDGIWDGLSWLTLAVPVVVYFTCWLRRR